MTVKIIVDSACDIPQQQGEELGIKILPLRYLLGEEEFLDGVTISNTEFYEKLEGSDLFPKTSQITPYQYEKAFEEALEELKDLFGEWGSISPDAAGHILEEWNSDHGFGLDCVWERVVTDFTAWQKRIVQIFADYIQPKIRELVREEADNNGQ